MGAVMPRCFVQQLYTKYTETEFDEDGDRINPLHVRGEPYHWPHRISITAFAAVLCEGERLYGNTLNLKDHKDELNYGLQKIVAYTPNVTLISEEVQEIFREGRCAPFGLGRHEDRLCSAAARCSALLNYLKHNGYKFSPRGVSLM